MTEQAKGPQATAKDKNPKGGLSAAGHKKFGTKKGVTNYSGASEEDKKRWVRWALRFTKTARPLKDDKGNPTRYALMFHAWGEPVPTSTGAVSAVHKKAITRAKSLKMGQYEKADETFYFEHEWEPVEDQPNTISNCGLCGLNRYSDEHQAAEAAKDVVHAPGKPKNKPGQHFGADKQHAFVPGKEGKCALCGGVAGEGHLAPAKAAKEPAKPYGDVQYADPGYQKDGKKRYPIDTAAHVRSAWSYISQSGNAKAYTPAQRERIKARIAAAAKRLNVNLQREQAELLARLQASYGRVDAIGPFPPGLKDMVNMGPAAGPSPKEVEDQLIAENAKSPEAAGPHPFMQAEFPDDNGDPRCRLCGEGENPHKIFEPQIPIAASLAQPSLTLTWNGGYTNSVPTVTSGTGNWTVHPRPDAPSTPVVGEAEQVLPPETAKAFLTEVDGHTLITAPANVFVREIEKAATANEHFLWMQGRFVGAEKANRNGAFWSTGDLELGELTVKHGPLNWLHEARHVIGTIAHTQMVKRDEQTASDLDQPYIEAASAIWRWIYPDEAWVIEQASDAGKLWYSMECVSKEVACVGVAGCGGRASYGEYLKGEGGTCEHMRQKSAVRHFSDPTFLGGAVIVPPVRPGWAEADASVIRQAASLAENTFEQAGRPDIAASEWEQLMTQIVRYGKR